MTQTIQESKPLDTNETHASDIQRLNEALAVRLLHDQKVQIWQDLHFCYSVINLTQVAMTYEDDCKRGLCSSTATVLEQVSEKLMNTINILDNLKK